MLDVLLEHEALFLLIGILVFGSVVLLPAIHLAASGELDPALVVVVALLAIEISDSAWYFAGRAVPIERMRRRPRLAGKIGRAEALLARFPGSLAQLLFLSRFLYGSRIAVSLLCGLARLSFRKVFLVNLVSALAWLAMLFALVILAAPALELLGAGPIGTAAALAALLVIIAFLKLGSGWLGRRKGARAVDPSAPPRVSVIIPACNEQGFLESAIRSVRRQSIPVELVVVENGSTDATAAIAARLADRVVQRPQPVGYSRARNLGAAVASGDWLVFLDADSEMAPDALAAIRARIRPGVFGTVLGRPDRWGFGYWVFYAFKNLAHRVGLYKGALGGLLFCESALYRRIGGFDENLEIDEIYDFSRRARENGGRYVLVTETYAVTSMRRFASEGLLSSTWYWCCLRFGVLRPSRLSSWSENYKGFRQRDRAPATPESAARASTGTEVPRLAEVAEKPTQA